jgi:hypothetical protein
MHTHIYLESIQSKLLATNHEFIGKKKKKKTKSGKKRERGKTHIRFCYTCQWMVRRQRYQKSIYKKKKSIRSLEFHGWQVVTEVGKSERLKMKGRGRERKEGMRGMRRRALTAGDEGARERGGEKSCMKQRERVENVCEKH